MRAVLRWLEGGPRPGDELIAAGLYSRPMTSVACVGALVRDPEGRLLVVLRSYEPAAGTWSLPGGRVDPGETREQACIREVREETGLVVAVRRHVGTVERDGPAGTTYVIDDYACDVLGGELRADTDAAAVEWVDDARLQALPLSPLLWETLLEWGEVTPTARTGAPRRR
jgi:ADP-ribose pyrophosphatase YjhB (NUDIX family)